MRRVQAVLVCVLVLVGTVAGVGAIDTRPIEAREVAWAKQVSGPFSLVQFDTLTISARKALFRRLSSQEKAAFWQEHTDRVLAENEFNAEQLAFIHKYRVYITPALYDADEAANREFFEACERLPELFEPAQVSLFTILGRFDVERYRAEQLAKASREPVRRVARWLQDTLRLPTLYADEMNEDCTCHGGLCTTCLAILLRQCEPDAAGDCTTVEDGCGCWGNAQDCTRVCSFIFEGD